jgi:hypothetical protein
MERYAVEQLEVQVSNTGIKVQTQSPDASPDTKLQGADAELRSQYKSQHSSRHARER